MVAMGERQAPQTPAVKSDDKGTFIECPKCQFKINLEENIDKCPSCGQSIFPF
jgi:rubrerythrin